MTPAERRLAASQEITRRTGIDEAMIQRLVETFYATIRADELLGPIFTTRVTDWDAHLFRMRAFWSSVALGSGVYSGTPMEKHIPLPVAADHFIERAERIAASLEMGVATALGTASLDRLRRPDSEVFLPPP